MKVMDNSGEKVIKHFPILEKMSTLTLEEKVILDENVQIEINNKINRR